MNDELRTRIKEVMIEELMLQVGVSEIGDETPIFGPDGLGLDSVDALQLVVALEKHFGLKLSDAEASKGVLKSVSTIAAAIGEP
jgi:acyl carrier protein